MVGRNWARYAWNFTSLDFFFQLIFFAWLFLCTFLLLCFYFLLALISCYLLHFAGMWRFPQISTYLHTLLDFFLSWLDFALFKHTFNTFALLLLNFSYFSHLHWLCFAHFFFSPFQFVLFPSLVSRVCVRARDAVCFIHEIIRETGDRTEEKSFFFFASFWCFELFFPLIFFLLLRVCI